MWTYKLHNLCRSVINLIKSEKGDITTFLTLWWWELLEMLVFVCLIKGISVLKIVEILKTLLDPCCLIKKWQAIKG